MMIRYSHPNLKLPDKPPEDYRCERDDLHIFPMSVFMENLQQLQTTHYDGNDISC